MGLKAAGITRRLAKLRAMSAREVLIRVRYTAALAAERRRHEQGTLVLPDNLERSLVPELRGPDWQRQVIERRRLAGTRFFPSVSQQASFHALFEGPFRAERTDCTRHAARARTNTFDFFGLSFTYADPIDWQRDPVTGASWPRVFHADVPVHGGDVGFGDVKHVWELSRQQYLIDLGKDVFLNGNLESLAATKRLVRSWIQGNPYATGVNWACALEPAFRAWSWLWAYFLTHDQLDDQFHLEWLDAFQLHGRFLAAHLEHYSSPYNHLIGEASALYALGVTFPEFSAAREWVALGRQVLETRLAEQFYEDGGTREQSTFYHHATLGFYLLAGLLARRSGEDLSARVWKAVERALEFSMQLSMPGGFTPEIGGADDGKPIRLEQLPLWDFRPYLSVGAAVFERPDFKAVAGRFYEDALWLLGTDGLSAFDRLPAQSPSGHAVMLPASGYYVARSGWSADADYVCFDVGEQAAGMRPDGVPNSMHGHADCLSLVLTLHGRRVLADSGLFAYNCGGEWEAHFRETAAHSTAKVDGRDQARHLGKMSWSHSYRASLEGSAVASGEQWVLGSHDGYARGPDGVVHRRAVWLRPGGYLLVWDEFTGQGEHGLDITWQFAPGTLEPDGPTRALFQNAAEVAWSSNVEWTPAIKCGGESPADGWICPSLGTRQPAPRLRLTASMRRSPVVIATVFATPVSRGQRIAMPASASVAGARLLRVDCHTHADWWVLPDGDSGVPGQFYPTVHTIDEDGDPAESHAILGRSFDIDAQTLKGFESEWQRAAAR